MSELQNNNTTEQEEKLSPIEIHKKELKQANDFYLLALIASGAVMLGGLVYAVAVRVFIGLLVAIAGILIYVSLTSNILYKTLGLAYKTESGKLTVTSVYGRNREAVYIPCRLLFCDVTEIGDRAFAHRSSENIKEVHLPCSLERIGENIFEGCAQIENIYFDGSREQWNKIEKLTCLDAYTVIFSECGEEDEK